MDKELERSNKEKVLRRLGHLLQDFGFCRTQPTYFTRPRGLIIEFVHVHKYTFGPKFRVHLGLRVTNDPFDAAALNGPDSHPQVCEGRFALRFGDTRESVDSCAEEIATFVREVAEPWFAGWRDVGRLLSDGASPLRQDVREHLRSALDSGPRADRVELTRRILGVGAILKV